MVTPDFFFFGGGEQSRELNVFPEGKKSKKLLKMADFWPFSFWRRGIGGAEPLMGAGGQMPHAPPPPWYRHCRGSWTSQFTPDKPEWFTIPTLLFFKSFDAVIQGEITQHLSCGMVKKVSEFENIYQYYSWQLHSDGFVVFIFFMYNISGSQNLKRCICKIQFKPMKNLMKIQNLAKHVRPSFVKTK